MKKMKELINGILFESEDFYVPQASVQTSELDFVIAGLKTTIDSLGILHHHIVGPGFFNGHEVVGEYYEKLYEILDEVIEIVISLGGKELNMAEAVKICPTLQVRNFTCEEVFEITARMFDMLIAGFEKCKESVPGDVYSKFEEYIFYLRKEGKYKLSQYLVK